MIDTRSSYDEFLSSRTPSAKDIGFSPVEMLPCMSGFRAHVADICVRRGRSAAFLDTGLGKTSVELEFARQCRIKTGKPSLILTPLAVARQMEREAKKFGYDAMVFRDQMPQNDIVICNYDRLHLVDISLFGSVVLDESSILKNFSGKTTDALISSFKNTPYKLCATATPAPNDHMELGTHAEFLGVMDRSRMLMRWFINDTSEASQVWRLKGHAVEPFWDWVASWAVMAKSPEDLGFDGSDFILPKLHIHRHRVNAEVIATDGLFGFNTSASGIYEIKRQTAEKRVSITSEIVSSKNNEAWVVWCDTDMESSALMKSLGSDDFVEVKGSMDAQKKENALEDFAVGKKRGIVTKSSVAGSGLNWQHAAHVVFVGRTFSYEAWYQAVRRCWRFGQKREVHVHIIVSEGEDQIGRVLDRKADDHGTMQSAMVAAQRRSKSVMHTERNICNPTFKGTIPTWL